MVVERVLWVSSILLGILTLLVSVLGLYLAYLSRTVEKRIHARLSRELAASSDQLGALVRSQLALVDAALCVTADAWIDSHEDHDETTLLYFLRHAVRLASGSPDEIGLALDALQSAGSKAVPLFPYIERIRASSDWPAELEAQFESMMRGAISSGQREQPESQ